MQQDKLLELLYAVGSDHLIRDTVNILEVVGGFNESAHIEVRGYGLE